MTYEVTIQGETIEVEVEAVAEGYRLVIDGGEPVSVDLREPEANVLSVMVDGYCYEAGVVGRDESWEVDIYGTTHVCTVVDPKRKALRLGGAAKEGMLSTSMPGKIVRILVEVGDLVESGQPVIIVEAMKMENEMKAPVSGTVAEILVNSGDAVESGAQLVRIDDP